jgi:hypothetical protein
MGAACKIELLASNARRVPGLKARFGFARLGLGLGRYPEGVDAVFSMASEDPTAKTRFWGRRDRKKGLAGFLLS